MSGEREGSSFSDLFPNDLSTFVPIVAGILIHVGSGRLLFLELLIGKIWSLAAASAIYQWMTVDGKFDYGETKRWCHVMGLLVVIFILTLSKM